MNNKKKLIIHSRFSKVTLIKFLPYLVIFILWFIFSSPYFLKGLVPFPSNYQVNNFSPWSSYTELSGPVKNAAQPDLITQIYPWRHLAIEQWRNGQIPLWNPYSFSGTPLLANFQSAVFSPLNLLFFLPIKFVDAWSIMVLFQPLLAGIFTYLYLRSLNASRLGGLLSAVSFMFCGFITTWMSYATLGYAVIYIPLGLYAIEKFFKTEKFKYLFLISLAVAFSLFSGHFQASLYTLIILSAYSIFKGFFEKEFAKSIKAFIYIIFGIFLAMPQILPTVELYTRSVRSGIFKSGEIIPWGYITTLVAPDFFGNPVTRNDWYGHYSEWNGYAGVIPLALASLLIFTKKTKVILFFLAFSLGTLLLAFQTPLVDLLIYLKIPVLSTSAPSRIIVLFSFSIAVLAGLGFDKLIEMAHKESKKIILWLIFFSSITFSLLGLVYFIVLPSDKTTIARNNLLLPVAIILLFGFIVVLLIKLKNKRIIHLVIVLIFLILSFDMLRFATKWQMFDPKDRVFKDVGISTFYKSQNKIDRAIGLSGGEDGVYYRFPTVTGYDPLYDENYGKFIAFVSSAQHIKPERSVVTFNYRGEYTPEAINLLGVKYIVHKVSDGQMPWAFPFREYPIDQFKKVFDDGRIQIFENNKAYKRAYVVNSFKVISDNKKLLEDMFDKNTDLSKTVYLNTKPKTPEPKEKVASSVEIESYTPNKINIKVNSKEPSILVLSDVYYPGWRAKVNNKKQQILRANYVFRGVETPKGESLVQFEYLPDSFLIGTYFTFIGLLGIIIGPILKFMNSKK